MDTEKCDQYLKIVRESTEKHINDEDMSRIIARDVKELDISVANEVLTESPNNFYMTVGASTISGVSAALFGYSAKATFLTSITGSAVANFFIRSIDHHPSHLEVQKKHIYELSPLCLESHFAQI